METPTEERITIGDNVVFDSEKGINVPANKRKSRILVSKLQPLLAQYDCLSEYNVRLKEYQRRTSGNRCGSKRHTDIIRALQNGKRIKAGNYWIAVIKMANLIITEPM